MSDDVEQIEAKLSAYIDGELSPAECAEIEQHLASHPAHMSLVRELIEHRQYLRQLPREKAPADVADGLQGQLEREALLGASRDERSEGLLHTHRWPQMLAAAAILFLAVGLALVMYSVLPQRGPTLSLSTLPADRMPEMADPGERDDETPAVADAADPADRPLESIAASPAPPALSGRADTPVDLVRGLAGAGATGLPTASAAPTVMADSSHPTVLRVVTEDVQQANAEVTDYLVANRLSFAFADAADVNQLGRMEQEAVERDASPARPADKDRFTRADLTASKLRSENEPAGVAREGARDGDASKNDDETAISSAARRLPSVTMAPAVAPAAQLPGTPRPTTQESDQVASTLQQESRRQLSELDQPLPAPASAPTRIRSAVRGSPGYRGGRDAAQSRTGEGTMGLAMKRAVGRPAGAEQVILVRNATPQQLAELADVLQRTDRRPPIAVEKQVRVTMMDRLSVGRSALGDVSRQAGGRGAASDVAATKPAGESLESALFGGRMGGYGGFGGRAMGVATSPATEAATRPATAAAMQSFAAPSAPLNDSKNGMATTAPTAVDEPRETLAYIVIVPAPASTTQPSEPATRPMEPGPEPADLPR